MTLRSSAFVAAAFLIAACNESAGPAAERATPAAPELTAVAASGIVLDQQAGVAGESYSEIGQGFNPTNPHVGDAIIATFFWAGTTNTITKVVDHLSDAAATPAGNTYTLVEYVTAGGLSMATYVATNVQGFPDPNPDDQTVLNVDAIFSDTVTHGGVILTAWSGVTAVTAQAVGAHRSATGSDPTVSLVGPGAIPTGAGTLAYAVTMANRLVGRDPPAGFTRIGVGGDDLLVIENDYAVQSAAGSVDPQWNWAFDPETPTSWLSTVLALNPPLHLDFTVQPRTTLPMVAMQPGVQVTVLDALGDQVTTFNGNVTIAIGHNGGVLSAGTLTGTLMVRAVDGVAVFSDLSIDQLGNDYTLTVSAAGVTGAESTPFNIGAF